MKNRIIYVVINTHSVKVNDGKSLYVDRYIQSRVFADRDDAHAYAEKKNREYATRERIILPGNMLSVPAYESTVEVRSLL